MNKKLLAVLAVVMGVSFASVAEENDAGAAALPPVAVKKDVAFATDIKPIFEKSCVKCHSGDRPKGRLKLDSLEGVLKGGKDGKVVEPGNSAKSDMVLDIAHVGDQDDWMPPLHNRANIGPLKPEQIGLIRAWIDQGAK